MKGDYGRELHRAELWQLIRDASEVEEIPMALIRELCGRNAIDCTGYHKAWEALCVEAWKVVSAAEDQMEVLEW